MPHLRLWFIYAKEVTFLAIGSNNKKMVSNGNTAFINRNILSKMYLCKHCRRWIDTNIHRMKMNKKEKKINDRCALPVLHIWANAPTDRSVDFRFIRFFFLFLEISCHRYGCSTREAEQKRKKMARNHGRLEQRRNRSNGELRWWWWRDDTKRIHTRHSMPQSLEFV